LYFIVEYLLTLKITYNIMPGEEHNVLSKVEAEDLIIERG